MSEIASSYVECKFESDRIVPKSAISTIRKAAGHLFLYPVENDTRECGPHSQEIILVSDKGLKTSLRYHQWYGKERIGNKFSIFARTIRSTASAFSSYINKTPKREPLEILKSDGRVRVGDHFVTLKEITDGFCEVEIQHVTMADFVPPILRPPLFHTPYTNIVFVKEASGMYYCPTFQGQGISIMINDEGHVYGSFYTYSEQGEQKLFVMTGRIAGNNIKMEMYSITFTGVTKVGDCQVTRLDANKLLFQFVTEAEGRMSLEMYKLEPKKGSLLFNEYTGLWEAANAIGVAPAISIFDYGKTMYGYIGYASIQNAEEESEFTKTADNKSNLSNVEWQLMQFSDGTKQGQLITYKGGSFLHATKPYVADTRNVSVTSREGRLFFSIDEGNEIECIRKL